jgi:hypothetical protein
MGRGGMDMQFAEPAAEGEMLLRRDVLGAEKDYEVFGERAVDLVHLAIGRRIFRNQSADVDARNFRTNDRGELLDADGLVTLGLVGCVAIAGPLLAGQPDNELMRVSLYRSEAALLLLAALRLYSAAVTVSAGAFAPLP